MQIQGKVLGYGFKEAGVRIWLIRISLIRMRLEVIWLQVLWPRHYNILPFWAYIFCIPLFAENIYLLWVITMIGHPWLPIIAQSGRNVLNFIALFLSNSSIQDFNSFILFRKTFQSLIMFGYLCLWIKIFLYIFLYSYSSLYSNL